jgi:hypothetical protein
MTTLRLKPLPPKLSSIAITEFSEPNLPGQSNHSPPTGFSLRGGPAIDATPFPGQKLFPEHLRSATSLPAFSPSVAARSEAPVDDAAAAPLTAVKSSVHRTEVIPDDSNPDFEKQLRLKPQFDSPQKNQGNQAYMYDPQHVLSFSLYDSCRKDALASSKVLSDLDLEPLGYVNVSIASMLRCIEMHEADPRTPLYVKFKLNRDEKQSMMSKTFEQLGSLHSKMNIFSQESKKAPKLVLHLTLIRFVLILPSYASQYFVCEANVLK